MEKDPMVVFSFAFAVMGGNKKELIGLISNDLSKYLLALILCIIASKKELFYELLNNKANGISLEDCDRAVPQFIVDAGGLVKNHHCPSELLQILAKEAEPLGMGSLVAMVQECMPQHC